MKKLLFLCALTWTCLEAQQYNSNNVCKSKSCQFTAQVFKLNMNTSVLPCQNFYEFMCGNYKKWSPLNPEMQATLMSNYRQSYIDQVISVFLNVDLDRENPSSLKKAKTVYQSCMDVEAVEKFGDIPIPLELNAIGLPIAPPFNLRLDKALDVNKLLAKLNRSPFTNFLFDVGLITDIKDATKTRLIFNYTPSTFYVYIAIYDKLLHAPTQVDRHCYCASEPEGCSSKSDEFENSVKFQSRSRLYETATKTKKETNQGLLKHVMTVAVRYMNELTNAPLSKRTNTIVEKRVNQVVDFLMKLEKTKELEKSENERNFDSWTYVTLDELQKETDKILGQAEIKIDWYYYMRVLFEDIHDDTYNFFKSGELIILRSMEQFKAVLRVLSEVSQKVVVSAMWWLVVDSASPYATKRFRSLHDEYKKKINKDVSSPGTGQCHELVKNQFSYLFAHVLIQIDPNAFETRTKVQEMVSNIRAVYQESITQATWLDIATKMAALSKLRSIGENISFSDWMTNREIIDAFYEQVIVIDKLFYFNVRSVKLAETKRKLEYLGKEISGSQQTYSYSFSYPTLLDPLSVNACYSPFTNTIEVPFGILGPPFHGLGLEALNYGAIGHVLSHEIGHAFDIQGKDFDSWGKKKCWWKKRTAVQYNEKSKCFVDFFDGFYFPEVNRKVNGKLTLAENIADFLGMEQAIKAYRKYVAKHGKEESLLNFETISHEKLLTMAFATINCGELAPSYLKHLLENDEHAPQKARVLGVLKNSRNFAAIWKCSTTQEMNPEKKCVLW